LKKLSFFIVVFALLICICFQILRHLLSNFVKMSTIMKYFEKTWAQVTSASLSTSAASSSPSSIPAVSPSPLATPVSSPNLSKTIKKKIMGFGSDGANVMAGVRNGIGEKLKAHNPYLISIHCLAHCLH
jgi:L-cystine uptake protein TcyP (sodium:dicarboxylate symporter family)